MIPARKVSFAVAFLVISVGSWGIDPPNTSDVYISEFMATAGKITILDEEGLEYPTNNDLQDWIELYNPTGSTVSLLGWSLSDDPLSATRWVFPDVSIGSGEFMIVFASGKNRLRTDAQIAIAAASDTTIYNHTNFSLENSGEYLGLFDNTQALVCEIAPEYPFQYALYSFGYDDSANRYRYMHPTPLGTNQSEEAFDGFLDPSQSVVFDPPRGLYDTAPQVSLSTNAPGATIRYTTDHSAPGWATGTVYSGPIQVGATTTIRAVALIPGVSQSLIETHTYLVNRPALDLQLPLLSLSMDPIDYIGPEGIAGPNIENRGTAWERPGSFEYFDHANGTGVAVKCGIRLHGGQSRGQGKKSFRLYFRSEYGDGKLRYPLMGDARVDSFDRLVLRGGAQDKDPFVLDELNRRLQIDMGHYSSRGTLANAYVIGVHKNYYNPCERLNMLFCQSWWGGNREWDTIHNDDVREASQALPTYGQYTSISSGTSEVFNEILEIVYRVDMEGIDDNNVVIPGFEMDPADYAAIGERLDLENYVDYIDLAIFGAVNDWPGNNWFVARERDRTPEDTFKCFVWDHEKSFGRGKVPTYDTISNQLLSPDFKTKPDFRNSAPFMLMFRGLRHSSDFRALMAERFRRSFFQYGALTDSHMMSRYLNLRNQIADALDYYFEGNTWGVLTASWIPGRRHNVEQQMDRHNMFERSGLSFTPEKRPDRLAINEFMAANSAITDETEDWIEIFNPSDTAVDMSGMWLTDNFDIPFKYEFPAGTTLGPGEYLIVWADGNPAEGPLHTPFGLDRDGEEIALLDTDGVTIIDRVVFGEQADDISYGRIPNGEGLFDRLPNPSPGTSNGSRPRFDSIDGFEFDLQHGVRSLLTADLNNDTFIDMVLGDFNHGALLTFFGQPGGGYEQRVTTNTGGIGQAALGLGDFNGDNAPDLVCVNDHMLLHTATVLLNDGNGAFILDGSTTFNTTQETEHLHPRAVLARDVNGDTHVDILIANESSATNGFFAINNVVNILLNDGSGGFTEAGALASGTTRPPFAITSEMPNPQALVAEDLDGDGDIDVVSLSGGSSLLVSINDGAGNFGTAVSVSSGGTKPLLAVIAADLDKDNDLDLVATDLFHTGPPPDLAPLGNVFVFLNDGSGNFTLSPDSSTEVPNSDTLLADDFDNDGNTDILVGVFNPLLHDRGGMQILFNDGAATFTVSDVFYTSDLFPFPKYLASADLDGDGDQDLAVADEYNGTLSVFQNLQYYAPPPSSVGNWDLLR